MKTTFLINVGEENTKSITLMLASNRILISLEYQSISYAGDVINTNLFWQATWCIKNNVATTKRQERSVTIPSTIDDFKSISSLRLQTVTNKKLFKTQNGRSDRIKLWLKEIHFLKYRYPNKNLTRESMLFLSAEKVNLLRFSPRKVILKIHNSA